MKRKIHRIVTKDEKVKRFVGESELGPGVDHGIGIRRMPGRKALFVAAGRLVAAVQEQRIAADFLGFLLG